MDYNGPRESDPGRSVKGEHGNINEEGKHTLAYRHYTPEFRARLALQVLQGEKELGEAANENSINPNLIRIWRATFPEKTQKQMLSTIGQLRWSATFSRTPLAAQGVPSPD